MTLRRSNPNKSSRPMTEAQKKANERSFRIFRLRGLWELARILTGSRQEAVQALIDEELARIGAEPQAARYARMRTQWAAEDAEYARRNREEEEWPF